MDFTIRIANKRILVHSVYSNVYLTCKEYLVDENTKPDIEIFITNEMLEEAFEKEKQVGTNVSTPRSIERTLLHQLIAESLLEFNTFLMHGAVVAVENISFLFSGKSGTGKTTHIKKWIENLQNSYVVNGDKPMIIINDEGAFACGTPWCGKEQYGTNTIVPLHCIVFMERSNDNNIKPISFKKAFPMLVQQTYFPSSATEMQMTLRLLAELKKKVSFYMFSFNNFKEDSFQVAYDSLCSKQKGKIGDDCEL